MAARKPDGSCGPFIREELPIPDRTRQTIWETPIPSSVSPQRTSLVGTVYKVKNEVPQLDVLVANADMLAWEYVPTLPLDRPFLGGPGQVRVGSWDSPDAERQSLPNPVGTVAGV